MGGNDNIRGRTNKLGNGDLTVFRGVFKLTDCRRAGQVIINCRNGNRCFDSQIFNRDLIVTIASHNDVFKLESQQIHLATIIQGGRHGNICSCYALADQTTDTVIGSLKGLDLLRMCTIFVYTVTDRIVVCVAKLVHVLIFVCILAGNARIKSIALLRAGRLNCRGTIAMSLGFNRTPFVIGAVLTITVLFTIRRTRCFLNNVPRPHIVPLGINGTKFVVRAIGAFSTLLTGSHTHSFLNDLPLAHIVTQRINRLLCNQNFATLTTTFTLR